MKFRGNYSGSERTSRRIVEEKEVFSGFGSYGPKNSRD
jgi:hypothetical protein